MPFESRPFVLTRSAYEGPACPSLALRVGLVAVFVALGASPLRAEGVQWLTDYNSARRMAHDKNLPLVIDFSTEHCVYCQKLETITFRDPAVVKLLGEHFVALHVHVAGAGKEAALAQHLNVTGYPTLIFADPDGNILARQDGFVEPAEFLQQANHAAASLQPSNAAVQQAVHLSAPPAEDAAADPGRPRRASQLLAHAQVDYREQRFLGCLDRCKTLRADYADLPEAAEAQRLESQIYADPDRLHMACDNLTDRLGAMYLDLAEAFIRKDQPQRAVLCLEWVVQACPGTQEAESAKTKLALMKHPK